MFGSPRIRGLSISILALGACEGPRVEHAEEIPRLVAEERVRIGSVDDPETSLTSFFALDIGPDGRIYTAHFRDRQIRIHGPGGRPLETFGRDGEGPGEFRAPLRLIVAGAELLVWDNRLLRVSYFNLDGGFIRNVTFRRQASSDRRYVAARPDWLLADGTAVGEMPLMSAPGAEMLAGTPILRFTFDGAALDTVVVRPLMNQHQTVDVGPEPTYDHQPFGDTPFWAVSAAASELVMVDGLLPLGSPRFRVTKMDISGDTLWAREYPFERVPLTASGVDEYVTRRGENFVRVGWAAQREAEAAIRASLSVPGYLPAASDAFVGRDGSVWIELRDLDAEVATWLSLSSAGDVVGVVDLPERFTPMYALGGELWGRDFDALDIPYIVKYEIHGAD